jgi:hypothetical protein
MGWNLTAIIIKDPGEIADNLILQKLYSRNYTELEPVMFDECIYPEMDDGSVYLGNYNGNLIISTYTDVIVEHFYTDTISSTEQALIDLFPNSEIGSFSLHSGVNYYAWAIISNGKKIRVKVGDADSDEDNNVKYRWPSDNAVYSENQIGENYVSRIWSRFTGTELMEDDELNNVLFRAYQMESKSKSVKGKQTFWQRIFGG